MVNIYSLMMKLLSPLFYLILLGAKHREKRVGYRVNIHNLPNDWIQGNMLVDMSKTWQKFGLPVRGLNYWTIGKIKNGLSARFIPGEKLYQAWLGGYIFEFAEKLDWKIEDYLKLCEADQKKWLRYFGIDNALMKFGEPKKIQDLSSNGFKGELFWFGESYTQSDVGVGSARLINRIKMSGAAYIFSKVSQLLKLKGNNFLPKENSESHKKINIYGYVAKFDLEKQKKCLLYVCMDKKTETNKTEMKRLINNCISIEKLPK